MIDPISSLISVWLVTVTVQFKEIDQYYSTYNRTVSFQSEQFCKTVLEGGYDYFEESFTDYWGNEDHEFADYTIVEYNLDCKEWYMAADGEWYMVGTEPTITI
tara:strand:+ start:1777 stop:2085 length:309 start_codon:yes stop_codon:yes gene_type:complete